MFKLKGITASGQLIELGETIVSASNWPTAIDEARALIPALALQRPDLRGVRLTDEKGNSQDVYLTQT